MSPSLDELRERWRALADQIGELGFVAAGSLLHRRTVCGTAGCACHTDPDRRHGPYWQYTHKTGGKTVTRYLTNAEATVYRQLIDNGRQLRALVAELEDLSVHARDLLIGQPQHPRPPAS